MTEIEKYIDKKVNSDLSEKQIPFNRIPDSLKIFWTEYYLLNIKPWINQQATLKLLNHENQSRNTIAYRFISNG